MADTAEMRKRTPGNAGDNSFVAELEAANLHPLWDRFKKITPVRPQPRDAFVRLARRGLRCDRTHGQFLLVEIDRHCEGGRSRVLLQDRHIFARGRLPGRLAHNESDRQHGGN